METQTFHLKREHSYDVHVGINILPEVVSRVNRMGFTRKSLIVTNDVVGKWYLEPLKKEFEKRSFECHAVSLPDGEEHKSLDTLSRLYSEMLLARLDRKSPVVALGGGVIGDITGFAAATFHRGLPFVQIPTTLLAMVDASIGGKVGANLPEGKNLIGTYHQPCVVGIDLSTLETLPLTQMSYGVVECLKHGLIADRAYFSFILKCRKEIKEKNISVLQRVVRRSLKIKKMIVEGDELDKGTRAVLNLGHTFGHALEILGEFRRFHHGEAVALGILLAHEAAKELGILKEDFRQPLEEVFTDFNLPTRISKDFEPHKVFEAMMRDKKREKKEIHLILPESLGKVAIVPIKESDLLELIKPIIISLYN